MGKKRKYNANTGLTWYIALFLLLLQSSTVVSQATRCDPGTLGSGSGIDPQAICGPNSMCQNNAECLCVNGYFSPSGSQSDCHGNNDADPRCSSFNRQCVFCGSNFQGPCMKCTGVVYNEQCFSTCPDGTQLSVESISTVGPIRTCTGTATNQVLQQWAIIVIIVLGVVVLIVIAVLIAALACTCLRRSNVGQLNIAERQEKQDVEGGEKSSEDEEEIDAHIETNKRKSAMEEHFEVEDDTYYVSEEDKEEFYRRLNSLRDQSEVFLRMLNDMRRRLKELPQNSQPVQQYKNVMRDLTRLLYMLNKKENKIKIPPDGVQLLTWSEQILNRYLLAQGKSPATSPTSQTTSPSVSPQRFSSIGDTAETDF